MLLHQKKVVKGRGSERLLHHYPNPQRCFTRSRNAKIQPIANYFGVSLAQLRGKQPIPGLFEADVKAVLPIGATLTPEEIDWIRWGRQLSPKHRDVLRALVAVYARMDQ